MQSETIIRNQMLFDVLCVADSCCWAHGPAGLGVLVVEMVPPVLVSGPNLLPSSPNHCLPRAGRGGGVGGGDG